ncbi:MAG: hypothetical protein IID44_02515 [Planctomycetes bacterium]|nr:hypothetical protein [Planctomycetota bacterium]
MDKELVSVIDFANQIGRQKSVVFKVMKRLGITGQKLRDSSKGNQLASHVTQTELRQITDELARTLSNSQAEANGNEGVEGLSGTDYGFFYLLQLEPDFDPGRFKVGFATSVPGRLRKHRCTSVFATVVKSWPCKSVWEQTAICCVAEGCEQLGREVFRTDSLDDVVARCDAFFSMMPTPVDESSEDDESAP